MIVSKTKGNYLLNLGHYSFGTCLFNCLVMANGVRFKISVNLGVYLRTKRRLVTADRKI